ncbi:hypothetical protein SEA_SPARKLEGODDESS_155 [Streptomyces phage SparkleGoddess]|uniref:Uncharacterized protein n=1 Tax=Streptomyces phage SparkleGoddess TaxID=2283305 RepID=A0A345ME62_9CAUD|nr:hypothetical protein SEA_SPARKLEGODDESS_155 [Streptomyces phage SparkleGoddess]
MAMPDKAPDSRKCGNGGNHIPRGAEARVNGVNVKYEKCTKCGLRVGDRKN